MTPHIPVAVGSMASSIEPTATGIEETLRKRRRTRATKCSLSFSLHVERILIVASTQEGTSSFFFLFWNFFRREGEEEEKMVEDHVWLLVREATTMLSSTYVLMAIAKSTVTAIVGLLLLKLARTKGGKKSESNGSVDENDVQPLLRCIRERRSVFPRSYIVSPFSGRKKKLRPLTHLLETSSCLSSWIFCSQ